MRYQPTDRPDRGHIGENWRRYQLRSMQIILQATHGIVSGEPGFFRRAFGSSAEEFEELLLLPHDFIFNRDWYERFDGKPKRDEFAKKVNKLTSADRVELLELLSSCEPREIQDLPPKTTSRALKEILPFYVPAQKDELREIWAKQKTLLKKAGDPWGADDERVEDAGLEDVDVPEAAVIAATSEAKRKRPSSKKSKVAA